MKLYIVYKVESEFSYLSCSVNAVSWHKTEEGARKRCEELEAANTNPKIEDSYGLIGGSYYTLGKNPVEVEE